MIHREMRDKLIAILSKPIYPKKGVEPAEVVADYLLDNGIVVLSCKYGEWKQMEFWEGGGTWRCTKCGRQIMFLKETPKSQNMKYCPECGAKMKGV